jgi:hypothetical protein
MHTARHLFTYLPLAKLWAWACSLPLHQGSQGSMRALANGGHSMFKGLADGHGV